MLTRSAQPTKRSRPLPRAAAARVLSAAGGVLLATFMLLLGPVAPSGAAAATGGTGAWPWPLLGEVITPYRNGSDPYAAGQHRGLDIAAPVGTPVLAIVDGRVSYSGRLPDGGETVTVRSADGQWLVSDLHLSSRSVARGDSVRAGQVLGRVGTTGRRSADQPHLHFGVRRVSDRAYVDPLGLLGAQRLPSTPAAADAPAASHVAAAPSARAPRVHVSPLERGADQTTSVHAQSAGDSGPATRHGALSHPHAADASASAGTSAREGHAASRFSRVAPPPLKSAPARPLAVVAPRHAKHAAAPAKRPAPSRGVLLAVGLVCLLALLMRRRPGRHSAAPGEPSGAAESQGEGAEVLEFRRVG